MNTNNICIRKRSVHAHSPLTASLGCPETLLLSLRLHRPSSESTQQPVDAVKHGPPVRFHPTSQNLWLNEWYQLTKCGEMRSAGEVSSYPTLTYLWLNKPGSCWWMRCVCPFLRSPSLNLILPTVQRWEVFIYSLHLHISVVLCNSVTIYFQRCYYIDSNQYSCQSISDELWFQGVELLTWDIDETMMTSLSSHFTDSCAKWAQIWFTGMISRFPNCALHIRVWRTGKERKGSSESVIDLYRRMPMKVEITSGAGNWTMCSIL
jgi:hypothetical protein